MIKKLYFALFYPSPVPKIVVEVRDAELVGNLYMFADVGCLRSRVAVDEVGTLLANNMSVSDSKERAVKLLRDNFAKRAEKHERKAEKLRQYSNLVLERTVVHE